MAGGIDWFRWHHGSVTDPKFKLVAMKAKASLPEVLAVWTFLLEQASSAKERGVFGDVDCESVDCLFGMEDGKTAEIMAQMEARDLIQDSQVTQWSKRQPAKEDETAGERKRRQREREHELALQSAVTQNMSRDVTQSHADVTLGHDREEERREEKKKESQKQKTIAPAYSAEAALCEAGVDPQVAADWLQVRKAKKSKPTKTGIDGVLQNIAKAGLTPDQGIRLCCERGWAGFNADWLTPQQARASPGIAWWATDQSIIAKGAEMGMAPRAGEAMPAFKGRVQAAIDNGGREPPPPRQQIVTAADIDDRKGMKPVGLDLKALIRPRAET